MDTISKRYLVTYHKDLKKYFWCDKWTQDGGWIVIQVSKIIIKSLLLLTLLVLPTMLS